jgi:hypothetical protein
MSADADADPLADADIGDTVRDERTVEEPVWFRNEVSAWCGWDRDVDTVVVEGAEIIGEPGDETIRVHLSAAVTKQEPAERSEPSTVDSDRPPLWRYFRFPAAATAIFAAVGVVFPGELLGLLPLWLFVMLAWMVVSIVSGAYPWSMPPSFGGRH